MSYWKRLGLVFLNTIGIYFIAFISSNPEAAGVFHYAVAGLTGLSFFLATGDL